MIYAFLEPKKTLNLGLRAKKTEFAALSDEVIEISSDEEETEDVIMGNKETASGKEEARQEQIKSLEAQISDMSLDLECPVCLNVCKPPIYSCVAQHPVCSGCRSNLKECAVCREPYKQGMIRHRYEITSCNYSKNCFVFCLMAFEMPAGMLKEILKSLKKHNASCWSFKMRNHKSKFWMSRSSRMLQQGSGFQPKQLTKTRRAARQSLTQMSLIPQRGRQLN